MPKLIQFSVEPYHMKPTSLRVKLRADTRTGKKLCWDKTFVAHDVYRSYRRSLDPSKSPGIHMWFTGSDAELVMFKLASNVEGVKIIEACEVSDEDFKQLNIDVKAALEEFKSEKAQLAYCRWDYNKYQLHSARKNVWGRKIVALYQAHLKQIRIHPDYIADGTRYEADPS